MSQQCERWEAWTHLDEEHFESCPDCREQWRAHQALADLSFLPSSELDSGFARRTRLRAKAEASPSLLSPAARTVMRIYWMLSTLIAGSILVWLPVTSDGWVAALLGLGALALGALPALLQLRQRMKWSLLDLVVWTAD